jgi:hypothetical protein
VYCVIADDVHVPLDERKQSLTSISFSGDIVVIRRFGRFRFYATIDLPPSSAFNDSAGRSAGAKELSCFKVRQRSRKARSRRVGLSLPDRVQAISPDFAARVASKATLEKDRKEGWITGSNDGASIDAAT